MVQGAVYDAVNAIDRGHRPYLAEPPAGPSDSKDAAAATAAFRVLVGLFPMQQSTLQPLYDASLAAVADTPRGAKAAGIAVGDGGSGGDARRPRRRRALRPVHAGDRNDPGRVAPDAAAVGQRPHPLGRKRTAVPGPRRRDAPHRRAERFDQPRLREGPQRGQADRLTAQHDPNAGRDRRRDLLARPCLRLVEPRVPHPRRFTAPRHRRQRTALRVDKPGRRRCRDRLLEQQVPLEHLAPDHRHPRGRQRRKPGNQGRPDMDTAVRSLHAGGHAPRCSSPLRSPNTPPATTARAARSSERCSTSSAPTGSPSAHPATNPGPREPSTDFSDALDENINARVWAGIHFRTADIAGARLGEKVARYLHNHYLQPVH